MSIDTACSSALVSTHVAAHHVQTSNGSALSGAINLMLAERTTAATQIAGMQMPSPMVISCASSPLSWWPIGSSKWWIIGAGMLTQEGRCKTLDASADGYVRAETSTIVLMSIPSGWNNEPCTMPEMMIRGTHVNQVSVPKNHHYQGLS